MKFSELKWQSLYPSNKLTRSQFLEWVEPKEGVDYALIWVARGKYEIIDYNDRAGGDLNKLIVVDRLELECWLTQLKPQEIP